MKIKLDNGIAYKITGVNGTSSYLDFPCLEDEVSDVYINLNCCSDEEAEIYNERCRKRFLKEWHMYASQYE